MKRLALLCAVLLAAAVLVVLSRMRSDHSPTVGSSGEGEASAASDREPRRHSPGGAADVPQPPATTRHLTTRLLLQHGEGADTEIGPLFPFVEVTAQYPDGSRAAKLTAGSGGHVSFDVRAGATALVFRADGLSDVKQSVPREGKRVGDVIFVGSATLELVIRNAPPVGDVRGTSAETAIEVRAYMDRLVRSFGGREIRGYPVSFLRLRKEGSFRRTVHVPGGQALRVMLRGRNLTATVVRQVEPISIGETAVVEIDLGSGGQLVGSLPEAWGDLRCGQRIRARMSGDWLLETRVGPDGRFGFCGAGGRTVRLFLGAVGEEVALADAETHDPLLRIPERGVARTRCEPVEPVVALSLDGDGEEDHFYEIGFGTARPRRSSSRSLWRRVVVEGADEIHVSSSRWPFFRCRPTDLREVGPARLVIPTPAQTGEIAVAVDGDWDEKIHRLTISPAGLEEARKLVGVRSDDAVVFADLFPGSYSLRWEADRRSWRSPVLAKPCVAEGERTTVEIEAPRSIARHGVVTNWDAIPAELRPTAVACPEHAAPLRRDGSFELMSWRPPRLVEFRAGVRRLCATEDVVATPEGLEVTYPLSEVRTVTVETSPDLGSRFEIRLWRDGGSFAPRPLATALANGTATFVAPARSSFRAGVWERLPGQEPRFRAWIESPPGESLVRIERLGGRSFALRRERAGPVDAVFLIGPPWPSPASSKVLFARSDAPDVLWIPDGTREVVIVLGGRETRLIADRN